MKDKVQFLLGCVNLDNQAKSEDSEAVLLVKEANLMSSARRVSGDLGSLQSSVIRKTHDLC